ncbi:MAG: toxin glutamine deamidase domain-containing protein [Trebonia sp.]|jgi:hypothetical protein
MEVLWDEAGGGRDAPPAGHGGAAQEDSRDGWPETGGGTAQQRAAWYRAAVDACYGASREEPGGGERSASISDLPDIAARHSGDYVPAAGPERAVVRPQELAGWLGDVNPDKADPGRGNNCGECSRAVARTWFGDTVAVAAAMADGGAAGEPAGRMAEWAGRAPAPMSMAQIGERLAVLGPGSLAVVGADWKTGGGHWFNAVNDRGNVLAVDGQRGRCGPWPPSVAGVRFDEGDMRYSDAIFFTPDGKVVRDDHPR